MEGIYYKSTRGDDRPVSPAQAIITGIARDGGLFVPNLIPSLDTKLKDLFNADYKELAYQVMKLFLTDFSEEELRGCIEKAYDGKFDTPEIAPLREHGGVYFLELFHGPTLAFKDMALSILPHLLKTAMAKLRVNKEIVILTATSGDTGKAALEGFANVEGTRIVVYFPEHGVSEIQKRQMVTQTGDNTHVIGIEGNFDDAQTGVKEIFADGELIKNMDSHNYMFSSANSINIGRLVPQIVYYFYAYLRMCADGDINPGEEINFAVPTGNFGNILAGYYAKNMGLPIKKLICASNENKVLYDFFNTGVYDRVRDFIVTMSPSMDILISSNLERLLYNISGGDAASIVAMMNDLKERGRYEITDEMRRGLKDFYGGFGSEADTAEAIKEVYETCDYIIDTHTAVSYSVYKKYRQETKDNTKTVIVSTASPFKFTRDVMRSIGKNDTGIDDFGLIKEMGGLMGGHIPRAIKDLDTRPVIHKRVCQRDEMKQQLKEILGI
jgi:threonine synthase